MISVSNTLIDGALDIKLPSFHDERGIFFESYNKETFDNIPQLRGIEFVQDNISCSKRGTLRGLHIQTNNPQGKLIRCLKGAILDVAVDLRPESRTFRKWFMIKLSEHNKRAFYIPAGCAHGFYSLSDSVVMYKCTTLYDKESDGGINPYFNNFEIPWPNDDLHIVSEKDKKLPTLNKWIEDNYGIKR